MAGNKTAYLQNAIIKHLFRGIAYTAPTSVYVALFTTMPNSESITPGGTEPSGNGYARQQVVVSPTGSSRFADPGASGNSTSNLDIITFPVATPGAWGLILGAGLYDALTSGNLLWSNTLSTAVQVSANYQFKINVGNLVASDD